MNPQSIEVRNLVETGDDFRQPRVGEHQRVAPAQDDLVNRRIGAKVLEGRLPVGQATGLFGIRERPAET